MGEGVLRAEERHPLLTASGRAALDDLLEATDAPVWNHRTGDRLDHSGLVAVRRFAAAIRTDPPRWRPGAAPSWVEAFVANARRNVPRLRQAAAVTTSRDDLERAWWELVPDDVDVDPLIWFPTSGTGRAPVAVPTHPVTVSSYYPLLLEAARWHGVEPRLRPDRADWMTVASQEHGGFTVPSWSAYLGCATAKVNLYDGGWRAAADRRSFLTRHDPQVITGDPLSLSHLADLDVDLHPAVLVSTALHLTSATRDRLVARFGCPVVDVYSTTESGPIAATRPGGGMGLLQPRLYVEIVTDDGGAGPPGELGAIALTGGMNPYLPLVRYRTGDTARLEWRGGQPVLVDLGGRPLVMLRSVAGAPVSSFEVTQLLEPIPLRRWSVHQAASGAITVGVEAEAGAPADLDARVGAAIRAALGPVAVTVTPLTVPDKVVAFTVEPA